MKLTIIIRKLQKQDEPSIIDICFITGDELLKKILPDPYLFSLLWCLYYVWYEIENVFVAENSKTKKIVGYILNTFNTKQQEADYKKKMSSHIKDKIKELKIKSPRTRITVSFILNRPTSRKRKKILEHYPAHLHINVLPDFQRQGIGHMLMQALEAHLKENNVKGYHLEVGTKNKQGINFYKKYNLELLHKNRLSHFFGKKIKQV
ncbi:MAG: GNAT family N-acetyltransferase [Asgard group archaeon]|nr:GNAT family N-acetyltransferase [Asgard group archaeon]